MKKNCMKDWKTIQVNKNATPLFDTIVIGGGASGLMAALVAAKKNGSVLLLEQAEKLGKKLYATGNGKCNYTNAVQTKACYRGTDPAFAMRVLSLFDVMQTLSFFRKIGIYPKCKNGYYYPRCEQAASIVEALTNALQQERVTIQCNCKVMQLRKQQHFLVQTDKMTYQAKNVILATGGTASKQLGSDGSGYWLAKQFGHHLVQPVPALVPCIATGLPFSTVAGVRTQAKIIMQLDGKRKYQASGEIQFTKEGISGIPVFELSRYAAYALQQRMSVSVFLDFFPEETKEELGRCLAEQLHNRKKLTLEQLFLGLLPKKLIWGMLHQLRYEKTTAYATLSHCQRQELVAFCKAFPLQITAVQDFTRAQVTAGGIATKEVIETTMESKLVKRLYLVGELLDIDGTCGGYNLQWAWTTGYLAGMAAGSRKYV